MALMALGSPRPAIDDGAVVAIYFDTGATPAGPANDVFPAGEPAALPAGSSEPAHEASPEAVAAFPPPEVLPLPDLALPPPEVLAPLDFSVPPPPPLTSTSSTSMPPVQPSVSSPPAPKPAAKPPARAAALPAAGPPLREAPSDSARAAPAPVAPSGAASVAPGWNALLAAWLAANRRYPDAARRRSEEGEVTVRFTVASDGRVSEAAVVKSSGAATLDAAALQLLQGAKLPAPGVEATRTVRLRYRLSD